MYVLYELGILCNRVKPVVRIERLLANLIPCVLLELLTIQEQLYVCHHLNVYINAELMSKTMSNKTDPVPQNRRDEETELEVDDRAALRYKVVSAHRW